MFGHRFIYFLKNFVNPISYCNFELIIQSIHSLICVIKSLTVRS